MSKFKLIAFILIGISIIFLNIYSRKQYTNDATSQIDGFTGCEKGFCS